MDYTPTDTDIALAEMLTENTGTHMLDSGGASGRAWQMNAGQTAESFYNAPDVIISEYDGKFEGITLDVFHWLRERVDIDQETTDDFMAFSETMPREEWGEVCEAYIGHLRDQGHEVVGYWGEGDPGWINTYNGEDALSQVLLYMGMEIDDEEKTFLRIHGGADVRGGYTAPRVFDTGDDRPLWDNAAICAVTHHPDPNGGGLIEVERVDPLWWDSDNGGYSWSMDGVWNGEDDSPSWKMVEGQVIYEPWGTTVGFMAR